MGSWNEAVGFLSEKERNPLFLWIIYRGKIAKNIKILQKAQICNFSPPQCLKIFGNISCSLCHLPGTNSRSMESPGLPGTQLLQALYSCLLKLR